MDFFSGLSKKFSDAAKNVSEKTKSGVEVAKLNLELKAKKDEVTKLFAQLGETFYTNQGPTDEMADIVEKIDGLKAGIEALANLIDKANHVRRCPNCGKSQSRDARFCAACGTAMPEDPVEEEPVIEEAEIVEEENAPVCPDCGAEVEADSQFCTVCGKNLSEAEPEDECEGCDGECEACECAEECNTAVECDSDEDCEDAAPEEEKPVIIVEAAEEPNEEETAEE